MLTTKKIYAKQSLLTLLITSFFLDGMASLPQLQSTSKLDASSSRATDKKKEEEKHLTHKRIVSLRQQELKKVNKEMVDRDIQEERKIENLDKHLENPAKRSDTLLGSSK